MIKSFKSKEAEKIFNLELSKRLPPDIQQGARKRLVVLNNAATLKDLQVTPAYRLEKLSGDRQGQYSIRINDQWRICFVWKEGDAYEVEIADYH